MTLEVELEGIQVSRIDLPDSDFEFSIGRQESCDVRLPASEVSRVHARLTRRSNVLVIEDAGSRGGTWTEGRRLDGTLCLTGGEKVRIGPYNIVVVSESSDQAQPSAQMREPSPPPASQPQVSLDPDVDEIFKNANLLYTDESMKIKRKLHEHILSEMNLSEDALKEFADESMMAKLETCVDATLRQFRHELPGGVTVPVFRQALMDEIVGYGPISPILRMPKVSEIMVNGPDRIFVECGGRLTETGVKFFNERHLIQIIQRIVEPLGRHVDDASPMVDARLPDGSRVNAVIPPLALDGASLTIRKFADKKLTTDDLIGFGSMTREMALFLEEAVRVRKNILVSGGTGSGKTTLLNVLSQFIPKDERVITIEDSAELKLSHRNIVRLEARPANIEGKGRIAIRDLVINCLRMRPDRIIVGECRGAEALDMLQAMNTGHDGSLSTGHANSTEDMLSRLETMVLQGSVGLPLEAIRQQIASAVDIIIHLSRLRDKSRKTMEITEVVGYENGKIKLNPLYVFEEDEKSTLEHVSGSLKRTDNKLQNTYKLMLSGYRGEM